MTTIRVKGTVSRATIHAEIGIHSLEGSMENQGVKYGLEFHLRCLYWSLESSSECESRSDKDGRCKNRTYHSFQQQNSGERNMIKHIYVITPEEVQAI
jgi:hypothetical protein